MYLIGENSISFPWYIPKDFPLPALERTDKERLINFIKTKQNILDWTDVQRQTYLFCRAFFPPLAPYVHRCFRNSHFRALQDELYETFGEQFWS